ncbi:MAG: type II toxin-antitoxin system MqsR family toxin [Gallionella sp.]|jgi:motility quorum-sensing regulator/GCU-specific mRNA interferase toxin
MEKLKNHYSLADIQAQMTTVPAMNLTGSARVGIREAGMAQADALAAVKALSRDNFYKSMTTHADHRDWQDVYRSEWNGIMLYIKFQRAGDYFVVSFKEL